MNKKIILSIIFLFTASSIYGFEWTFDKTYNRERLYLHVVTNYAFDHRWEYKWERKYLKNNQFKINYGSVTTSELLSDVELIINQEIGKGVRFQNYLTRYSSLHKNSRKNSNFMGFEKSIFNNVALFLLFNPYSDKEKMDGKLGFTIYNSDREKYLKLGLQWNDFVYNSKNGKSGNNLRENYILNWKLRTGNNKWTLFSKGQLSNGLKREFTKIEKSPEINFHENKVNEQETKLYYQPDQGMLFELRSKYYHFFAEKHFWDNRYNFAYENDIYQTSLYATIDLSSMFTLRNEVHYILQNSRAEGYRNYDYNRHEIFFPDIFLDCNIKNHVVFLGYFGSTYKWNFDSELDKNDFDEKGYIDKVILGWTYKFPGRARLKMSISHITTVNGFGGGNLQYIMFF